MADTIQLEGTGTTFNGRLQRVPIQPTVNGRLLQVANTNRLSNKVETRIRISDYLIV